MHYCRICTAFWCRPYALLYYIKDSQLKLTYTECIVIIATSVWGNMVNSSGNTVCVFVELSVDCSVANSTTRMYI